MSLFVSNAGRLKPEHRLAEAVSQFKSSLSSDQKVLLDADTSQALNNTPTASDVIRFTAEFNNRISTRAGRRCYGPRIANFLQSVQQFAALGDVVIGGSQNIIACGVWSLVRMSLLAIVNISSYLESLSLLFMEIGRSAPRNQAIALLYPQSRNLQAHMNEYFIVVVRLCHRLMTFVQKSALRKLTTAIGDMDLKAFRTELDLWSGLIRDEMGLHVAQRIESETCENSKFRALSNGFSQRISHEQKVSRKLRLLDLCSQYDYRTAWKQIRKIGNTRLFADMIDYQIWRASVKSCTLLLTGKLGSGKSVSMANMVEDLNVHTKGANATVAYFFCKHDIPESLEARTIIGALVRQILQPVPEFPSIKESYHGSLSYEDMLKLLRSALPRGHLTYVVLDGLDLCSQKTKETVIEELNKFQQELSILLCVTYRLEPNNTLGPLLSRFFAVHVVPLPDNQPDIEAFVQAELEYCVEQHALVVGEPGLILDIHDALVKGAQGMFLWAALQIKSLCALQTDAQIKEALLNLPKDLPGVYSQILGRLRDSGAPYQRRTLELVIASMQPLTTDEMREALSVTAGDINWDPAKLLNDVHLALANNCGCLLIIDEEEMTVRLIHPSVEQFLLSDYEDSGGIRITRDSAYSTMADIIVTYASYGVFDNQVSTNRISPIPTGSVPSHIVASTLASTKGVQSLALKLLKSRRGLDIDVGKVVTDALAQPDLVIPKFHFQSYIKSNGLIHISSVLVPTPHMVTLFPALLRLDSLLFFGGWDLRSKLFIHMSTMAYDISIMLVALASARVIDDIVSNAETSPSTLQLVNNFHDMVCFLLETKKFDFKQSNSDVDYAMNLFARNGYDRALGLLLARDDVALASQAALREAIINQQQATAKLLLNYDKAYMYPDDSFTLMTAIAYKNVPVLEIMLASGKVKPDKKEAKSILSLVERKGNAEIRQLVLEAAGRGWYLPRLTDHDNGREGENIGGKGYQAPI